MKNLRKDNKGFSLVELIVVVLIMAIIAVALAPQVLKWVNNSRIANDRNLMDTLVSNSQTTMTNQAAYDIVKGKTVELAFSNTGDASYKLDGTTQSSGDAFVNKFAEYSGYTDWADMDGEVHTKASGNVITISITATGKVTGSYHSSSSTSEITLDNE